MTQPEVNEDQPCSTSRRGDLTLAERYELQHRAFWASSICMIEDAKSSVISGLEFPVVGGMVNMALEHAIATAVSMMRHADDDLRWTSDVAIVLRGRFLAAIRHTARGPAVTRFDAPPTLPAERVLPGRRPSRRSCLCFIDGSLESTCYGVGIPLDGRDLADALEHAIRSFVESTIRPDTVNPDPDDVAFGFRGQILAAVRFTPTGADVTRFDLPGPSSEPATDEARSTPSGEARRRWRADRAPAVSPMSPWPSRATR